MERSKVGMESGFNSGEVRLAWREVRLAWREVRLAWRVGLTVEK